MSNRLNEIIEKFNKSGVLERMIGIAHQQLEDALIDVPDSAKIFNSRYKQFLSLNDREKLPTEWVIEEFISVERHYSNTIIKIHLENYTAKSKQILKRSYDYLSLVNKRLESTINPEQINNTFLWADLNKEKEEIEYIKDLYRKLNGDNKIGSVFLGDDVTEEIFIKVFTGKPLKKKIHWIGPVSLLILLIDELTWFLELPDYIISKTNNKTSKEMSEWLHPKIIACFNYGTDPVKELTATSITSNRTKLKKKNPKLYPVIIGIIETLRKNRMEK